MKRNILIIISALFIFNACEKEEDIVITSIQIDQTKVTLKLGEQYQFSVNHTPDKLEAPTYTWSSANPQVVTVNQQGEITAEGIGSSYITVKALNGSLISNASVTVIPIEAEGIVLDKSNIDLLVGETAALTYNIEPENTTNKEVEWTSDNTSVATVEDGNITAISPGEANIKVKVKNTSKEAVCLVKVSPIEANSISLDKSDLSIMVGETASLSYVIEPENTTYKEVVWSSDNDEVATVSNGEVTALSPGLAKIKVTIKDTNTDAVCQVEVMPIPVSDVSLSHSNVEIVNGDTFQLNAIISPSNATDQGLLWESSNTETATVSNGLITGLSPGEVVITVTTSDGGFTATCQVEVLPVPVESVSLNMTNLVLVADESSSLVATILPSNAANTNVTWSSSNPDIATVDNNGNVLAISNGATEISVTTEDGGYIAVCSVSVVPITEKIELTILDSGLVVINGFITGQIYSRIQNNSSFPITLKRFEVVDTNNNLIVASTTDPSLLGTLNPGESKNLGSNFSSLYLPIFRWYFEYDGTSYTVEHQYEINISW
jgi:uncharacterized protein YjdB